jgi:hypothetical protein
MSDCSHAASVTDCGCPDRLVSIPLDVRHRTKKDMRRIFGVILQLKDIRRWTITLVSPSHEGNRVFLNKNKDIEGEDKYVMTREEVLEYVMSFYLT